MFAIISCTVLTSLAIWLVTYSSSLSYINRESSEKLGYLAAQYAQTFNRRFLKAQSCVDTLHAALRASFEPAAVRRDPAYLSGFTEAVDRIFRETVRGETGFHGLYMTVNPELDGTFYEVWYLDLERDGTFKRVDNELYNQFAEAPLTGPDAYPSMNVFYPENPAMGYYYQALEEGGGIWYEPWSEPGLPLTTLGYSRPLIKAGTAAGVIGIDITIDDIKESILNLTAMDWGYAFLITRELDIIAHPSLPERASLLDAPGEEGALLLRSLEEGESGLVRMKEQGRVVYTFSALQNGWVLVLAPDWNALIRPLRNQTFAILLVTVLLLLFSVIAAYSLTNRLALPLEAVGAQLHAMERGDYSREIPPLLIAREDELGQYLKSVDHIKGETLDLKNVIRQEVEKNRQKDAVMIFQSRQARMGELIAYIAHQWRQPLNNLSLILSNLREGRGENLRDEGIAFERAGHLIQEMSRTIEDFRNFLKPDQAQSFFDPAEVVRFSLDLMEPALHKEQIDIQKSLAGGFRVWGTPNELGQVISNILVNARDALCRQEGPRRINLALSREGASIQLSIGNNGPLISEEEIPLLFCAYKSGKGREKGTGIGLYMSRIIIEEHFRGQIALANCEGGVLCTIRLPAAGEGGKQDA